MGKRKCNTCGNSSKSENFERQIFLPVKNSIQSSLTDVIRSEEVIDYTCCGSRGASLRISYVSCPSLLLIAVKRFKYDSRRGTTKIRTKKKAEDRLIMNGKTYILYAVILHHGSATLGHYTAYVKKDEGWFGFDDDKLFISNSTPNICLASVLAYYRVD